MDSFTTFFCEDLLPKGLKRAFHSGTYTFARQGNRIPNIDSFITSLGRKKKEEPDTDTVYGPPPLTRRR